MINLLAQDLHINYILDASVKGGTVTINTYGAVRDLDLRPLLETILRMNGLAMVQVGNIYRIIPAANIARQPISPISETDGSKLSDDERLVLNLVFLRYVTSGEMQKILLPFMGDGAQLTNYEPANLLIILDNSRNMRRTLELISMFDSDTFAGQRVRPFEVKNGRPSDMAKELDDVFKAYSLSGDKGTAAVHFLPLNRINTILAVAPNPGAFAEVEKWIQKLDVPAKVTAGSVDNYVYKLKYGRAEILGGVINQLYGGCGFTGGGHVRGNDRQFHLSRVGLRGGSGIWRWRWRRWRLPGRRLPARRGRIRRARLTAEAAIGGRTGMRGRWDGGSEPAGGFGVPCVSPSNGTAGTPTAPITRVQLERRTRGGAREQRREQTAERRAPRTRPALISTQPTPYGRTSGPRIIPNPYDNTLLVQGTPQEWEQIRHLLEQLDIPPRQVLIDAKIYEVDLNGDLTFGVESFLQKRGAANANGSGAAASGNRGQRGNLR